MQRNLYGKIKRDWVGMFVKVQTEERQQRPFPKDSVGTSNNLFPTPKWDGPWPRPEVVHLNSLKR